MNSACKKYLEHLDSVEQRLLRSTGLMIRGSVCNLLKYNFFPIEELDVRSQSIFDAVFY